MKAKLFLISFILAFSNLSFAHIPIFFNYHTLIFFNFEKYENLVKEGNSQAIKKFIEGYEDDKEVLEKLINSKDRQNGYTLLHTAIFYKYFNSDVFGKTVYDEIIDILLQNGVDVNAQDKEGDTPLHIAALYGDSTSVSSLLQRRANPSAQDEYGHTPLHEAITGGNAEVVQILINKSDVNARSVSGITPLDRAYKAMRNRTGNIASVKKYKEIISILEQAGAK